MARTDPRPNYGSKRRIRGDGYVDIYAPNHPLARREGYVFEHRMMAWDAGILTDPTDEVHHVNEIRNDNRLENFEIKSSSAHARDHAEERGFVTNQYGTFVIKPRQERGSARWPSEGFIRPERPCQGCDGTISSTRRSDAKFCSKRCQLAAWKRAHPEQVIPRVKLTSSIVVAIRQAYAEGCSQSELASRYGVAQSHISNIVNRKRWSEVV